MSSKKIRMLFSIDPEVAEVFRVNCLETKANMSKLVEDMMKTYNKKCLKKLLRGK